MPVNKLRSHNAPWRLTNENADVVTNRAAKGFIDAIQNERTAGFGFVPFIGAGFSAPSGAPLVNEIKIYLQRCICMALGAEDPNMVAWNPQTDQWPPFIDRTRPAPLLTWPGVIHAEILRRTNLNDPDLPVIAEGFGATAEWRTSLLFLSRLSRPPRGNSSGADRLRLDAPSQEIIDSCLREVLKGKHPALEHNMLAVLAGALRLDLILTTNFDDLLERAFAAARNPLQVSEVHLNDPLPHWSAVSDVRSLIKLHGNRHSLRADYSLDKAASETDKRRFLEYLLSAAGRCKFREDPGQSDLPCQNHLLVMGVAADDRRSVDLIRFAWQKMDERFRIFWLCYTKSDVDKAKELTRSFDRDRNGREPRPLSIILRYPYFGHFLLQLYQHIRKNLPPLGTLFPSVSRLTFPPLISGNPRNRFKSKKWNAFCAEIHRRLENFEKHPPAGHKLVVACSYYGVRGVTSACSQVFRELEQQHCCLWLDMNDISSAGNLFEVLLEAAYFRLGLEHWTPVALADNDPRPLAEEIDRLVKSVSKPWIVFLNARETPGANTDYDASKMLSNFRPHGWLDDDKATSDPSSSHFLDLLTQLCGANSPRISIVLACRAGRPSPHSEQDPGLFRELRRRALIPGSEHEPVEGAENCLVRLDDALCDREHSEAGIVSRVIVWADTPAKRRFLHALILMQRPRLLATIWSPALAEMNTLEESKDSERLSWLDDLEEMGLVRRKPGGFVWIHSRCRQLIRFALSEPVKAAKLVGKKAAAALKNWQASADAAGIHTELADWYVKVLDACESPPAAFEAIYHLCKAAEACGLQRRARDWVLPAAERLDAATALLKSNSFLIQTHGYSRGSCRRLDFVRLTLCGDIRKLLHTRGVESRASRSRLQFALKRLELTCLEVMRAIAREVGEDAKAYTRHATFGDKLVGQSVKGGSRSQALHKKLLLTPEEDLGSAKTDWLRWWRWSGMLAIASRSFAMAKKDLQNVMKSAADHRRYPSQAPDVEWNVLMSLPLSQPDCLEILRAKELFVETLLLESAAGTRLESLKQFDPRPAESIEPLDLPFIERHIREGRRLAAAIRGRDQSADSRYISSSNWAESRLLMHQSVCAALHTQRNIAKKPLLFQTAMGLLGDAEASLRISDARRYRTELALVELHRAEVRLREAESIRVMLPNGKTKGFGSLCRELEKLPNDVDWRTQGNWVRETYEGEARSSVAGLRRAQSLAIDALRFLTRAEPVLRERRRNVWWTTWFFERNLRSIALSIWASIFEKGTPIPFLGLEAAMRLTDTVADTLLADSVRMIRVDAYRLATIVDAYGSCAKALQVRLMLDAAALRLPERQNHMKRNLANACVKLRDVASRREKRDGKQLDEKDAMDPIAARYVQAVIGKTENLLQQLERPYA